MVGAVKQITWDYAGEGCPAGVRLSLYNSGVYQYTIAGHIDPGAGAYNWTVSGNQAAEDDYRNRITSNSDINVHDYSDAAFSIRPPGQN